MFFVHQSICYSYSELYYQSGMAIKVIQHINSKCQSVIQHGVEWSKCRTADPHKNVHKLAPLLINLFSLTHLTTVYTRLLRYTYYLAVKSTCCILQSLQLKK